MDGRCRNEIARIGKGRERKETETEADVSCAGEGGVLIGLIGFGE